MVQSGSPTSIAQKNITACIDLEKAQTRSIVKQYFLLGLHKNPLLILLRLIISSEPQCAMPVITAPSGQTDFNLSEYSAIAVSSYKCDHRIFTNAAIRGNIAHKSYLITLILLLAHILQLDCRHNITTILDLLRYADKD